MKHLYACFRSFLALLVCLLAGTGAYANHILAMDLYYTWLGGNTYKITAVIYGDCDPTPITSGVFALLSTAQPVVCIFRNGVSIDAITLNIQPPTTGQDITPVCPAQRGMTQCEDASSLVPGISRFVYTANYTLPAPVNDVWTFGYFGNNTNSQAGRSANVTNIVNPGNTIIQLTDTLDNTISAHNSNAQFSVIPTPFFCLNTPDSYNPGAVDSDHDSLSVINLITAYDAASTFNQCMNGIPVTYSGVAWSSPFTPISATTPLKVQSGSYNYDNLTGQLNFIPNAIQRSTIVYNVREFRDGHFVGNCQREMNFLVQSCSSITPSGGISGVTNGIRVDSAHFTTCSNSGPFSMTFDPREPGTSNHITITSTGIPTGATFSVTANGTTTPHGVFSWTSTGTTPGTYIFYLTYTDDNCPLAGTTTTAISVTILPAPHVSFSIISPVTCTRKEVLNIIPSGTGMPWNITISGATTQTFTGVTGSFVDSLSAGTNIITITTSASSGGCPGHDTITINSPAILGNRAVCMGSTITLSDNVSGGTWSISNSAIATITPATGVLTGVSAGTATISYSGTSCVATATVNPVAPITGIPVVCTGNTVQLSNTTPGGTWSSSNAGLATINSATGIMGGVAGGHPIITYTTPAGCISTVTATVNEVQPITGVTTACKGSPINLSDATAGGSWSSNNTAVATVGSTGVVSTLSAGTAVITYTGTGGCFRTVTVTINPIPSPISGPNRVCAGSTITLSDSVIGGIWTSGSPAIATVSPATPPTRIVTGVTAGVAQITYAFSTGCMATYSITVNTVLPVTGITTVCKGTPTVLSDATTGGTWSSSNTAVATITPATGIVTTKAAGTSIITYTATTGCINTTTLIVNPIPSPISGPNRVCTGSAITLSDTVAGGTWTSGATGIATVTPSTGVVTGVAAGVVQVTYAFSTGCNATYSVTVNTVLPITGIDSVCVGSTLKLSDATPGGTWSNNNTALATVTPGTGIVSAKAAGLVVITYTTPAGCSAFDTITINPLPSVITGPTHVCATGQITLSDSVAGGMWSSALSSVATITPGTGVVSGVSPGNVLIKYTLGTGCFVTKAITVNATNFVSAGKAYVCAGSNISLSNATAGGSWTSNNTGVATVSATGIVHGITAGTAVITYLSGACTATTTSVIVNPIPSAITDSTGSINVCLGRTTALSDSAAGGTWSSSNSAVATINPNTGIVTGVTTGTAIITYAMPGRCFTTTTITVNVNPDPVTGVIEPQCQGQSITLSDAIAGGTWTSSATTIATVDSVTGVVTGTGGGNVVIYYATGVGCVSPATITVTPLPNAGMITGAVFGCPGTQVVLSDTISGGTWSISNTTVASLSGSTVFCISPGMDTISFIYTNVCGSDTTTKVITVGVLPFAGVITGPSGMCIGANISLSDTVAGGVWSSSTGSIATVTASGLVTSVSPGATDIVYAYSNSCGTDTTGKIITVYPLPPVDTVHGPTPVCIGAAFFMSDAVTGGTWASSNVAAATIIAISGAVDALGAGNTIITYYVGPDTHGCVDSASFALTVLSAPDFTVASNFSQLLCYGDKATGIVAVSGGSGHFQYMWSNGDTAASASDLMAGTYSVTVTDIISQCTEQFNYTITQPDSLVVTSHTVTNDKCTEGKGAIHIEVSGGVPSYTYLWSNGAAGNEISSLLANMYTVTITDMNSCVLSFTDTVKEDTCDVIIIHDVITPNGDGINDKLVIEGLDPYPDNVIQIFDKWGDLVYEKRNYNNDWSGQGKNGELPDGTYFYLVRLNAPNKTGGKNTWTGSILIKR